MCERNRNGLLSLLLPVNAAHIPAKPGKTLFREVFRRLTFGCRPRPTAARFLVAMILSWQGFLLASNHVGEACQPNTRPTQPKAPKPKDPKGRINLSYFGFPFTTNPRTGYILKWVCWGTLKPDFGMLLGKAAGGIR